MLNPDIIDVTLEVDALKEELKGLEPFEKLVENLNKNRALTKAMREQMIQESLDNRKTDGLAEIDEELQQLGEKKASGALSKTEQIREAKLLAEKQRLETEGIRTREKIEPLIAEKEAIIAQMLQEAEAGIPALPEEKKLALSEAYYAFGQDLWNKSYQTPLEVMPVEERKAIIQKGLDVMNMATELNTEYPHPYSYIGLLYREMIKVDPQKRDAYIAKNEEYNKKFVELYQKKVKAEQYQKALEDLSKE